MKRFLMPLVAAVVSLSTSVWAGPYDQPYGTIEMGDRSVNRKHEPATINKIDGQSTSNPRRPDPVAPGKHVVKISFSTSRVTVGDQLKTIEIDVEACKRYRVVAHYHTPASGQWEPVVQAVEDIGECRKKFMKGSSSK
jgi:hypothetical protein